MENTNVRTKAMVLSEMSEQVMAGTNAIRNNDLSALNTAEDTLHKLEKEYEAYSLQDVYTTLKATENPVLSAITTFTYGAKKSREVKTDGTVTALEVTDTTKRIDLLAFCKKLSKENDKLDTSWEYDVQKLNKSLALRAASELKLDKAAVDTIKTTFKMATAIINDKVVVPTSNAQIVKMLQSIVDKIIFDDNGDGKNKYKVTSHDVAHLLMTYTQRDGKNALAVRVSKHRALIAEVMTVCHKIVTGKSYELIYKQLKNS